MTEIQKRQGDWDKIERGLNWSKWAFPRDLKKKYSVANVATSQDRAI